MFDESLVFVLKQAYTVFENIVVSSMIRLDLFGGTLVKIFSIVNKI